MNNFLKEVYKSYLVPNKTFLTSQSSKGRVLVSYLPASLYQNRKQMTYHQNRREANVITNVFLELGYDVDVVYSGKKAFLPNKRTYKIIFGIEPNFERYALKYPDALKIYYATGAYWKYQNNGIIKHTKEVNIRKKTNIKPSRLVEPHNSCELADHIVQIGTSRTVETYPEELRSKIHTIRQSSFEFLDFDIFQKDWENAKKRFVWFGGKGAILKGLDLLLDVFVKKPNLTLYVCGSVEKDFEKAFRKELYETNNIHYLGWVPLESSTIKELAKMCAFNILPSVSEGSPGSIINLMRLGMIPIVSRIASLPFEKMKFLIDDLNIEKIGSVIEHASLVDNKELMDISFSYKKFVEMNYNLKIFENDFRTTIEKILSSS